MPSSRDVGGRDLDDTIAVPSPIVRSRHAGRVEPHAEPLTVTHDHIDEVRCPTCGRAYPGLAARCPDDGTELSSSET